MILLEVNTDNVHLSKSRGFIVQTDREGDKKKIAFDNVDCLLIYGYSISYSHNLITELCTRNIPVILCGKNFMPAGYVYSYPAGCTHNKRFLLQVEAGKVFYKQMWQTIVKAKIRSQASVLKLYNKKYNDLLTYANTVKSGDKSNAEAVAARKYWKRLFGKDFSRQYDQPGINACLNFGYAVLRACIVREIVAKGLIPEFGIHHCNTTNPYCLADDIIEPFRPFVDMVIKKKFSMDDETLTSKMKLELIKLMSYSVLLNDCRLPLKRCIKEALNDFVHRLEDKKAGGNFAKPENLKWVTIDVDDSNV